MKNKMPPIYVDIDDVLCETASRYVAIAALEFGKSVRYEDLACFDMQAVFGMTARDFDHFFQRVHQPDILLDLEPVPGAIETLNAWQARGLEIAIVTGRPTSVYEETLAWLADNNVCYQSFHMVDKYGHPGVDPRIAISLEELAGMQFQAAVEDSFEMAAFLAGTMQTPVLLHDRPWNRQPEPNPRVTRCRGWQDIQSAMPADTTPAIR